MSRPLPPPCAGCGRPTRHVQAPAADNAPTDCFACQYCAGVLIPSASLEKVVGTHLAFSPSHAAESRKCPRCSITMATEAVKNIVVDRCSGCREVFLDAGELEKVAERQLFLRKSAALQAQTDAAEADFKKAHATAEQDRRRAEAASRLSSYFDFSRPFGTKF